MTGAVRRGVLPGILAALTAARACVSLLLRLVGRSLPAGAGSWHAAGLLAAGCVTHARSSPAPSPSLLPSCSATREQLKGATDPATRAVLDCRQKALKITGEEGALVRGS